MQELPAHLMVTAVIAILGKIAIEFMNFLLKRRLVKNGQFNQHHLKLLTGQSNRFSALKWGLLSLFGGLGLVVIGILPFKAETSPVPWGVEVIFLGLGFLVYYAIIKKIDRN